MRRDARPRRRVTDARTSDARRHRRGTRLAPSARMRRRRWRWWHWLAGALALLLGALVAEFRFDHPKLHIDLRHAEKEAHDKTPVKERGWQEAALAVYP